MSKRKLNQVEILKALDNSNRNFSADDAMEDIDWLPSDSESENDIEPVDVDDAAHLDAVDFDAVDLDAADLDDTGANDYSVDNDDNVNMADDDGIVADIQWSEFSSRQKTFTFTGKSGLQQNIASDISCLDAYLLFADNKVIDMIVEETNKYAQQYY